MGKCFMHYRTLLSLSIISSILNCDKQELDSQECFHSKLLSIPAHYYIIISRITSTTKLHNKAKEHNERRHQSVLAFNYAAILQIAGLQEIARCCIT